MRVEAARAELGEKIARHTRFALHFGGGKDSLTCLYLLRPWWGQLVVMWGNMGDPLPETVALMDEVRGLVREFHEVRGNSFAEATAAYPVDLLPIRASALGRALEPEGSKVTLRSRYDCCWNNLWAPIAKAVREQGITLVIRGQRDSESLRAPTKSGDTDPRYAELCFPIQSWSAEDVHAFLKAEGVTLPRTYQYMRTSLDCMHCTAFMEDARGRVEYLRAFHPDVAVEYERRLSLIAAEQKVAIEHFQRTQAELAHV